MYLNILWNFKIRILECTSAYQISYFQHFRSADYLEWFSHLTFYRIDPFSQSFHRFTPGLWRYFRPRLWQWTAEMLIPHNFLFCLSSPLSRHRSVIYLPTFYTCMPCTFKIETQIVKTFLFCHQHQWWFYCIYEGGCFWHWWCNNKVLRERPNWVASGNVRTQLCHCTMGKFWDLSDSGHR